MSHTPGPWNVLRGRTLLHVENDPPTVAICSMPLKRAADACLIAAAPDLLAALESLLAVCVEELDDKRTPEMRQARNAIAKAKRQA